MSRTIARLPSSRFFLMVFVVALSGCEKTPYPTYPVEGTVKFADGAPMERGWVESRPKSGTTRVSAKGAIQSDGSFQLHTFRPGDGAVEGIHQVIVIPTLPTGQRGDQPIPTNIIETKHTRYETSNFEFGVDKNHSSNHWEIIVSRPLKPSQ